MSIESSVDQLATVLSEVSGLIVGRAPVLSVSGKFFARMHEEPEILVYLRDSVGESAAPVHNDPEKLMLDGHRGGGEVFA
ncbi:hypothetical protein [Nesterenkonia ebinurensis]|uniref:hypothetical protein n=1 Tax=Nesterenkonia ebinurensis TaxID=2608252 RepID=UPI00123DA063|nr:hypothetical protein [Nesterenkonia ebinurensis]